MADQEKRIRGVHIEANGIHYYKVVDDNGYAIYGVTHNSGVVKDGNKEWFWSESPIALDGFGIMRHIDGDIYYERDDEYIAPWLAQNIIDNLPLRIDTEEELYRILSQAGFTFDPDYVEFDKVEPLQPYKYVHLSTKVFKPLTDVVWQEAVVPEFRTIRTELQWESAFPYAIKVYPELHYLFPCRVKWDDFNKSLFEKRIDKALAERGAKYNLYTQAEISFYSHTPDGKTHGSLRLPYPDIVADNLAELIEAWEKWIDEFVAKANEAITIAIEPCPLCFGSGHAKHSPSAATIDIEKAIDSRLRQLWTKRNSKEVDELRGYIRKLKDAVSAKAMQE